MTIREALKTGNATKIGADYYELQDGRKVLYDRFVRGNCKWICDDGYAYRNFFEVYHKCRDFARKAS